ncbi:MAG TPA: hypothetical protein VJ813_07300 [Vicinamibacterales bacterium]|nr:hypothetical protein [Vicinamibacterales bacterium]
MGPLPAICAFAPDANGDGRITRAEWRPGCRLAPRTLTAAGVPRTRRCRLYLGVNDDHLPGNRGQYRVTISVQRQPGLQGRGAHL